jgi:hypothetical protein
MVKAPMAGRVKTRLARQTSVVRASAFYRQASGGLIQRLAGDRRWQTVLAVAPDSSCGGAPFPVWPPGLPRLAQGGGDLGERLQRIFDRLPPGPVVVIGSDCPYVMRGDIADAFAALGGADAVLGPADDGGYWLVGARRFPTTPRMFDGVRWSSATTLADTCANLDAWRVALLRQLSDVDSRRDLERTRGAYARRVLRRPCDASAVEGPSSRH